MKARQVGSGLALLLAIALVVPMTAAASTPPASVYHGTWDSASVCGEEIASGDVMGVWNINLKDDGTATVTVRIFEYGRIHAAWGGNSMKTDFVQQTVDPVVDVFQVKAAAVFGLIDTIFTLDRQGELTYELAGYCELMGGSGRALLFGQVTDD